ncbi:vacuolar cation/proton exchanger 5 [Spatholobus suberectus]|nr:vacuolar cation/proton exchanger 5 [Spatholobus suberectus]
MDTWSYFEAVSLVKDLGYLGEFRLWWKKNNVEFEEGLKEVYEDKQALDLGNYAILHNTEVDIYVEHISVNEPNFVTEESLLTNGDASMNECGKATIVDSDVHESVVDDGVDASVVGATIDDANKVDTSRVHASVVDVGVVGASVDGVIGVDATGVDANVVDANVVDATSVDANVGDVETSMHSCGEDAMETRQHGDGKDHMETCVLDGKSVGGKDHENAAGVLGQNDGSETDNSDESFNPSTMVHSH